MCRTHGLPLRWLDQDDEGVFEARDICELNAPGAPLEALAAEECWTIGPVEQRLQAAQARFGDPDARVSLRSLFTST